MKRTLILCLAVGIAAAPAFSGVVKKTKADVTFKGFGRLTTARSEKLMADRMWVDSQNDFKGQGFLGGLAGKTILRPGNSGEIVNLPELTVLRLDPKKKEYTVGPIKKLSEETKGGGAKSEGETQPSEESQSEIKITRSDFKVEDTGETSTINNFPVKKYTVNWLTEWENVRTGEKGANQLTTVVWATPISETLAQAQAEEMKFSREYLKAMGLNSDKLQQEILGTSWMSMLDSMNKAKGKPSPDSSKYASELSKIKGYPVVVDGQYFVTAQNPQGEAQPSEDKSSKSLLGGLAKKVMKKKPTAEEDKEPALSYHTELIEISLANLSAADFLVPADYKKKG
jgi:hypothetical protein